MREGKTSDITNVATTHPEHFSCDEGNEVDGTGNATKSKVVSARADFLGGDAFRHQAAKNRRRLGKAIIVHDGIFLAGEDSATAEVGSEDDGGTGEIVVGMFVIDNTVAECTELSGCCGVDEDGAAIRSLGWRNFGDAEHLF